MLLLEIDGTTKSLLEGERKYWHFIRENIRIESAPLSIDDLNKGLGIFGTKPQT